MPWAKPGANLAATVASRLGSSTAVVVPKNHGLTVVADSVAAVEALLGRVIPALRVEPEGPTPVDVVGLEALAGPGLAVPEGAAPVHQPALDPARVPQATGGSLYPDHVIFCGVGARAHQGSGLPEAADAPPMPIVPGKGVLIRCGASSAAQALARCRADVPIRVPPGAELTCLTGVQTAGFLDSEAETCQQSLNARGAVPRARHRHLRRAGHRQRCRRRAAGRGEGAMADFGENHRAPQV